MTGTEIRLPDSQVGSVTSEENGSFALRLAPANVVKSQGIPLADPSTLVDAVQSA